MFSEIRKTKIQIPFFSQRISDYAELARLDLITFRNEMISSIVSAALGAAALLLLLGLPAESASTAPTCRGHS